MYDINYNIRCARALFFLPRKIYYFHVILLTDSRRGVSVFSPVRSSMRRHATLVCDIRFSDNNTLVCIVYYKDIKFQRMRIGANRRLRDYVILFYTHDCETNLHGVVVDAFSLHVFPLVYSFHCRLNGILRFYSDMRHYCFNHRTFSFFRI